MEQALLCLRTKQWGTWRPGSYIPADQAMLYLMSKQCFIWEPCYDVLYMRNKQWSTWDQAVMYSTTVYHRTINAIREWGPVFCNILYRRTNQFCTFVLSNDVPEDHALTYLRTKQLCTVPEDKAMIYLRGEQRCTWGPSNAVLQDEAMLYVKTEQWCPRKEAVMCLRSK